MKPAGKNSKNNAPSESSYYSDSEDHAKTSRQLRAQPSQRRRSKSVVRRSRVRSVSKQSRSQSRSKSSPSKSDGKGSRFKSGSKCDRSRSAGKRSRSKSDGTCHRSKFGNRSKSVGKQSRSIAQQSKRSKTKSKERERSKSNKVSRANANRRSRSPHYNLDRAGLQSFASHLSTDEFLIDFNLNRLMQVVSSAQFDDYEKFIAWHQTAEAPLKLTLCWKTTLLAFHVDNNAAKDLRLLAQHSFDGFKAANNILHKLLKKQADKHAANRISNASAFVHVCVVGARNRLDDSGYDPKQKNVANTADRTWQTSDQKAKPSSWTDQRTDSKQGWESKQGWHNWSFAKTDDAWQGWQSTNREWETPNRESQGWSWNEHIEGASSSSWNAKNDNR